MIELNYSNKLLLKVKSLLIITCILNCAIYSNCQDNSYNDNYLNNKTNKALVLLDDWLLIQSHSLFWNQIKHLNYELEFKTIDDSNIKLDYYGEKLYDIIILYIPSFTEEDSKMSSFSVKKIVKYFDEGHNIMIIADKHVNSYIRSLSTEFGIDFDDYNSQVKDSLYLHKNDLNLNADFIKMNTNTISITKNVTPIKNVFRQTNSYILYEGIGLEIDVHNKYAFPILSADENAYSVNSENEIFYNVGEKIKLVAGYQGRNNKRVTILGSYTLCSNKFYYLSSSKEQKTNFDPLNSPNALLCEDIINWNFEKTGILAYNNIKHHKLPEEITLETYRVKDDIEYMVDIFEFDYKNNIWKPYLTDDLQIEFTMMDPFYRIQMKIKSPNKPTYYTSFKVIKITIYYLFYII